MFRPSDAGEGAAHDTWSAMSGETVQGFLRRVTRPWHQTVEDLFAPFDLATAAGLGDFLLRQSAAVLPVERALEAAGVANLVTDWSERKRSAALLADLQALGLQPPGPGPAFPVPSAAHALGSLYVLEGSKLGGRVLSRRVLAAADAHVRAAKAYLSHHQPGGWARFVAILNAADTLSLEGLRAGAEATFARFRAAAYDYQFVKGVPLVSGSPLVHFERA